MNIRALILFVVFGWRRQPSQLHNGVLAWK